MKQKKFNPFKKFLAPETQIVKHGKWYAIAPLAIIAIGLLVVLIFNFNLGLDFTGGQIIKIDGINRQQEAEVRAVVREVLRNEENLSRGAANRAFFQREDGDFTYALTARYPNPRGNDNEIHETNTRIRLAVERELGTQQLVFISVEPAASLSASASTERLMNVFIAVFAALIGILLYMLFRFKFTSGVAAIIGLFHDVLIMLACVAIFQIQINFVFVAAVITVVAYSLNNSIVLLDRVRDKERDVSNTQSIAQKVDSSIKETFWRTTITTVTTLVPIIILTIFGVPLIQEFALPIIFGLLAGTYSTICITSSLYVRFENAKVAKAKLKKKNA